MRFERIARRLMAEPWMILPAHHAALVDTFNRVAANVQAEGLLDLLPPVPTPQRVGNVMVLPVKGVISRELSQLEKACGGCDLADVREQLAAALADPNISGVVLDIDSPGGTVTGVEETAAAIEEGRGVKPILAYTGGMACSAAYWLAASASAVYAAPSATIGSIGVYMAMLDTSRAMQAAGVSVDLIKSTDSPLKAAGFPGTSLTPEQRADLQAGVDHIYTKFAAGVSLNRKKAGPETMKGQTFQGDQAVANGLADSLASLSQTIADVERLANIRTH